VHVWKILRLFIWSHFSTSCSFVLFPPYFSLFQNFRSRFPPHPLIFLDPTNQYKYCHSAHLKLDVFRLSNCQIQNKCYLSKTHGHLFHTRGSQIWHLVSYREYHPNHRMLNWVALWPRISVRFWHHLKFERYFERWPETKYSIRVAKYVRSFANIKRLTLSGN
jgi:hypothetical protein